MPARSLQQRRAAANSADEAWVRRLVLVVADERPAADAVSTEAFRAAEPDLFVVARTGLRRGRRGFDDDSGSAVVAQDSPPSFGSLHAYADAAERMQAGGMDGIELQSCGHLFDAWWSPGTNRRSDEWGSDFDNRLRFPWLILEAVREHVGPDFIVGLRIFLQELVPGGFDLDTGMEILRRLEASSLIDLINVAKGSIHNDVELTSLIPIHGIASAPMLDLVGMTRAQIADPHLVNKIMEGRESEIRPCVGATYCLDRLGVDVLGGDVTPTGSVLFFDDNGTHSAMSAAEMVARSGCDLEIVTPERMLGIEVGGMNHVPYARAFNETDTRITLNQRLLSVRP